MVEAHNLDVVRKAIAPTGALRASINYGNIVLAQRAGNGPRGVTAELSRELARQLELELRFIEFDRSNAVFNAQDSWDICFLAIEPKRAADVDFSPPYLTIDGCFLTRKNSAFRDLNSIDRPDVRIGVSEGSAYDLYLSRTLTAATLVRTSNFKLSLEKIMAGTVDVLAGVKVPLEIFSADNPDFEVLPEKFMTIRQAIGVAKGRDPIASNFIRAFVESRKASGFVAEALENSGQDRSLVAPAESF